TGAVEAQRRRSSRADVVDVAVGLCALRIAAIAKATCDLAVVVDAIGETVGTGGEEPDHRFGSGRAVVIQKSAGVGPAAVNVGRANDLPAAVNSAGIAAVTKVSEV